MANLAGMMTVQCLIGWEDDYRTSVCDVLYTLSASGLISTRDSFATCHITHLSFDSIVINR
jgi:hypothetical protein